MKLKIVSNGTLLGTRITDENGNLVTNVTALDIRWQLDAKEGTARARVGLVMPPADVEVEGYLVPNVMWVGVDEFLPQPETPVWAYTTAGRVLTATYHRKEAKAATGQNWEYHWVGKFGNWIRGITHWAAMTPPAPPFESCPRTSSALEPSHPSSEVNE